MCSSDFTLNPAVKLSKRALIIIRPLQKFFLIYRLYKLFFHNSNTNSFIIDSIC